MLSVRGQVGVGKKPHAFQRPTAPRQPVGPAGQLGAHQTTCIMSPPSCSRGWPFQTASVPGHQHGSTKDHQHGSMKEAT